MKIVGSVIIVIMLVGCGGTKCYVPEPPKPSQYVLDKIRGLNDEQVDEWMTKEYKYHKLIKEIKRVYE